MSRAVRPLAAVAVLFLAWVPAALSADDKAKDETPSEKIRKALDQPIDLELKESSLAKAVERFHEKTKLDIIIDRTSFGPLAGGVIDPNADQPVPLQGKFKGVKVRDALRKAFEPWGMAPFIVDDAVLLTSEDAGIQKQLKQRIDVDVDDVSLATALKQLARRKAINLVVDQKVTKQAEKKVSLQVEDVALESAVRLLAEQAGLKAARIDNVLYVTSAEQAASIAAENRTNTVPAFNPYGMYGPYGPFGAIGLAGAGGALGALGGGGLVGLGGGIGGLGGGIGGLGGGIGGLGGGIGGIGGMRGMPLPLPPPPAPAPEKPAPQQSMGLSPSKPAPAVAAADHPDSPDDTPAGRPQLWARPAGRPPVGARRSRRRMPAPEPRPS